MNATTSRAPISAASNAEPPPRTTAIGALAYYVSHADAKNYQPTNITHGIMPPLDNVPRDKMKKKLMIAERAAQWIVAGRRGGTFAAG